VWTLSARAAISAVLLGAALAMLSGEFLRDALAQVPKGSPDVVAAAIRAILAQADAAHVRE
jgi:putative transposase